MIPRLGLSFLLLTALLVVAVQSASLFEPSKHDLEIHDPEFQADAPGEDEDDQIMGRRTGNRRNNANKGGGGGSLVGGLLSGGDNKGKKKDKSLLGNLLGNDSGTANKKRNRRKKKKDATGAVTNKDGKKLRVKKRKDKAAAQKSPEDKKNARTKRRNKRQNKKNKKNKAKTSSKKEESFFKKFLNEVKDEIKETLITEAKEFALEFAKQWLSEKAVDTFCTCEEKLCQCCSTLPAFGGGCLNAQLTIDEDENYIVDIEIKKDKVPDLLASITIEEAFEDEETPAKDEACAEINSFFPKLCMFADEVEVTEDKKMDACFDLSFATLDGTYCLHYDGTKLSMKQSFEE